MLYLLKEINLKEGDVLKKISLILPFILAGICPILFNLIGSEITAEGILKEPFFLIPMMYVFLLIGLVNLVVKFATGKLKLK